MSGNLPSNDMLQYYARHITSLYSRVFIIRLPMHISPASWIKYKYTIDDIVRTLYTYDTQTCMNCLRVINPPDNSGRNLSTNLIPCSSKRIIIEKIRSSIVHQYQKNTESVLTSQYFRHTPLLPVVYIPIEDFQLCSKHCKVVEYLRVNTRKYSYNILQTEYIPITRRENEMYAVRIVPVEKFIQSMKYHTPCRTNYGFDVLIDGIQYIATEEAIVFKPHM